MVRLLLYRAQMSAEEPLSFNPTMVRLLRAGRCPAARISAAFQSHNGAIAAVSSRAAGSRKSQFQSHNGAIAAMLPLMSALRKQWFQSHNGAIAAGREWK